MTLFHRPQYRLSKLLARPGGKPVSEALKDAQAGLDSLQEACIAFVEATLARIDDLYAKLARAPDETTIAELYKISNDLIGAAATARLPTLDRAAYGLCELLDRMSDRHGCDLQAIKVHVEALHLFRKGELADDGPEARGVLEGLSKVRERYAANDA